MSTLVDSTLKKRSMQLLVTMSKKKNFKMDTLFQTAFN